MNRSGATAAERRRLPSPRHVASLIGARAPRSPRAAALERCADIEDVRQLARRRVPRSVFDYVDGAAGAEVTLARAMAAFDATVLRPRVLRDVSTVDTSVELFGRRSPLPFGLAPTGFTRMMHHQGERAAASAAAQAGIPYGLSTLGTTSVEDLAAAVPDCWRWFQLYMWRDRDACRDLVQRAAASGYETLVVTVDTPVGGRRLRDIRNGLAIPPRLQIRTLTDMALHPRWVYNSLTTEPLTFATLQDSGGTVAELLTRTFDPSLTLNDIAWLRAEWAGQLVVKGIQHPEDAAAVAAVGVDGVVLSTHGGRQLDQASVPVDIVPRTRELVGPDVAVILDGGIRRATDILAALAAGADFTLIGRAYLYGLMAAGQQGVTTVIDILTAELRTSLALLGVPRIADIAGSGTVERPTHHPS